MYDITQNSVSPAHFKSLNKELKLEVQLGMLCLTNCYILTQRGQVTHF
jgi:ABC-2 type transport system ATP-binding protein